MDTTEPAWFNPVTNFIALIIGAALSYFVTWKFERRREKREQKAQAFGLIFLLQSACNDLMQLTNILREISFERSEELAAGTPLWQLMPISFGWDQEFVIKPEELGLLAGTKDNELVMRVQETISAHRIYTRAANRVSELKLEFVNSGLATSSSGQLVSFQVTEQQLAQITPIISQLDALCTKLSGDLAEATHRATECARLVPRKLKEYYKFDHLAGLVFKPLIEDAPTK